MEYFASPGAYQVEKLALRTSTWSERALYMRSRRTRQVMVTSANALSLPYSTAFAQASPTARSMSAWNNGSAT